MLFFLSWGNQQPSVCQAVSANPLPPRLFHHLRDTPLVWEPAAPPTRLPICQPTLPWQNEKRKQKKLCTKHLLLHFYSDRSESDKRHNRRVVWLTSSSRFLMEISCSSPNAQRHAFFWCGSGWLGAWWHWLYFRELLDWQLPRIWGSYPTSPPT